MENKHGSYPAVVIDIEDAQEERKKKRQEALSQRRAKVRWERDEAVSEVTASVRVRRVLCVVVIIIMFLLVAAQGKEILDLKKQESAAERELAGYQEMQARLEKELKSVDDPAYVEAKAREKLKMIRPGEILYIIEDELAAEQNA
jgi:cell division protein FtsB